MRFLSRGANPVPAPHFRVALPLGHVNQSVWVLGYARCQAPPARPTRHRQHAKKSGWCGIMSHSAVRAKSAGSTPLQENNLPGTGFAIDGLQPGGFPFRRVDRRRVGPGASSLGQERAGNCTGGIHNEIGNHKTSKDRKMRKRMIAATEQDPSGGGQAWLDLPRLADVEITSEDPAHPIESALLPHGDSGWRAADPGPQTIRLELGAGRNGAL